MNDRYFKELLDNWIKLSLYRTFVCGSKNKVYLHGTNDALSRLMLKFGSGTHGLRRRKGVGGVPVM